MSVEEFEVQLKRYKFVTVQFFEDNMAKNKVGEVKVVLKKEDPVDKTALESKITEIAELKEADYTEETWASLQAALKVANETLEKVDAT